LGPESFHHVLAAGQEASPSHRARRCLLKECEQWFEPSRPQSRYCSDRCAAAARRWRQVKASRRYRASDHGRAVRREQNRRYRQRRRRRQRQAASGDTAATREGQRPAFDEQDFCERMCDRPGCYVLFLVKNEHICQRFCSLACRLALRRVLDREWRYRRRRQRWRRELRRQRLLRPDTS
jgi:hypothetical protein